MAESIKITGLRELRQTLKAIDAALPKELNRVSKDAAELVAETGRSMAPKLTGRLAAAVKTGASTGGSYVGVRGVVYAPPIHWGWPKHNIKPNPFLYHALDARRDDVLTQFDKAVQELINRNTP